MQIFALRQWCCSAFYNCPFTFDRSAVLDLSDRSHVRRLSLYSCKPKLLNSFQSMLQPCHVSWVTFLRLILVNWILLSRRGCLMQHFSSAAVHNAAKMAASEQVVPLNPVTSWPERETLQCWGGETLSLFHTPCIFHLELTIFQPLPPHPSLVMTNRLRPPQ